MSETTDRHQLPYVIAAQSQKHVTVNEAFRALDALVQPSVRSATLAAQPADPAPGEGYVLPDGATGEAWSAMPAGTLAVFQDGAWTAFAPRVGMTAWVEEEGAHRVYDGDAWVAVAGGEGGTAGSSAPQTAAPRLGVNATADDTNRLVVASASVLHTHDGADARHVMNKAAPSDTASLVFQTDYSGRAEIGLTGGDDLAFKVSADGTTFREAIVIDRADGSVRFPNTQVQASGEGDQASGGVTRAEVAGTAEAFASGLRAGLVTGGGVAGGNLALTRQVVLSDRAGKVQIASAADGNLVETYPSGAALAEGTVKDRLFMRRGEVAVLTDLPAGAIVASTHGVAGVSEGQHGGPFPLAPEGFAARQFFFFVFRGGSNGQGRVYVAAGAVPATARLLSGDGARVVDEAAIPAFGLAVLRTDAEAEFQVRADQPVLVGTDAVGGYTDLRLVPPLSPELIGWGNSARVSALYPDTTVRWHARGGQSGSFTVSPGSPVVLGQQGAPGGSGYPVDSAVVLRADGPISAFSGADGAGSDATPYCPLGTLGQLAPLPLGSAPDASDPKNDSITVAGPYEGTARVYASDGALVATLPLTRGAAAATPDDQLHPCAAQAVPAGYAGGWVEADVPIYVVQQSNDDGSAVPGSIRPLARETVMPTVTPDERRTEVRRDEAGMLRRRCLDADGQVSWPLC